MRMKKIQIGVIDKPKLRNKVDFLYYWSGSRLIYYGTIAGEGKTVECKDIASLEKYLNYRENEQKSSIAGN